MDVETIKQVYCSFIIIIIIIIIIIQADNIQKHFMQYTFDKKKLIE